jgi:hypothetical protein
MKESCDIREVKFIARPKHSSNKICPENIAPFQSTKRPPKAPFNGIKANLSNLFGAKFLI